MYLLSSTGRMDGDNEYSRDDELWILWDPVSKSKVETKVPKSTAGLYKCTHGQIYTYTGTQDHTYRAKIKSMEWGKHLANHVYDEELVPKTC